jgi:hypothetical protein
MTDPNAPQNPQQPAAPQQPPTAPPPPPAPQYGAPQAPQPPQPPQYGAPQQPYGAQYGQQPARRSSVLSIISLIAGIVGVVGAFVFDWIPFVGAIIGLIISAAAIVLGFLGKSREPHAKGMWLTGIILGFVGVAIDLVFLFIWIAVVAAGGFTYSTSTF